MTSTISFRLSDKENDILEAVSSKLDLSAGLFMKNVSQGIIDGDIKVGNWFNERKKEKKAMKSIADAFASKGEKNGK